MKRYVPLFLLLAASACSTVRPIATTDSTKVEVRTETVTVHDTAWVELPVMVERVATLDTASVLENKYARSEASVSGGLLTHSLETKPVREPVKVEKQIVYRDSLVYRDRVQTVTKEVEKKLTSWQSFKMKAGGVVLIILILALVSAVLYCVYRLFNNLNP